MSLEFGTRFLPYSNQHNANILPINGVYYLPANLDVLYSLECTHPSGCSTFILDVWTDWN